MKISRVSEADQSAEAGGEEGSRSYDILVAGGGPAGVVAATQAAAGGARTLLLERGSQLGGTTTTGGVNFPGLFHAWGRQIIAGYGWKLVARAVSECGQTLPDFSVVPARHWHHQVPVDRAIYTMLCDEMVVEAGADIRFHTLPAKVEPLPKGWRVTICGKGGLESLDATCLIDCTGDANLVALAGGDLRIAGANAQPGTQVCHAAGYDLSQLDMPAINRAFAEAVGRGELDPHDVGWNLQSPNVGRWLRKKGENANHIPGINALDSRGRSAIELAGRRSVLRLYRFLRKQPGLENLRIEYLAPECGVRETVNIVGDRTVTADDYLAGKVWEDSLSYAFYPVDLHTADGKGLQMRELSEGVVPTVPRAALLPRGLERIAVAGRSLSSDREANSGLRVQAASMAMGQAVAAMAVLACRKGCDFRALDPESIRKLLREHDAITPKPL